ncbi:MAG: cytochrome c biogenesis protein ResB [Lewinellaceae bacterium]|nr:cytochrome c biogenesis protein ResB [Phaeodactylibacter sp.]MCB0614898.1 cytochrome c biogenesis protein ResB [Phaeodactylibacter sp.]MCB9347555.1 cytochrome c biogenesis protein ResB [Lewinellaceae bacterium]
MADIKTSSSDSRNHDFQTRGFRKATILLSAMVLFCLLAQNMYGWAPTTWASILAPAAVVAAYLVAFYKPLKQTIDTPYFATLSLLAIALGTALGTFVSQNAPAAVFTQRYGETGSSVLRGLQLDDVFHSWWYIGFFVLLAGSLLKMSWKRKLSRENLGFHLAHLGPIVILLGFWVDYFYGFRGIIQLETGQSSNVVRVYRGSTNYLIDSTALPFQIRLDHFEFEKHDPDYRLQVWRNDTEPHPQPAVDGHGQTATGTPEVIASLPLKEAKIRHIYGTDVYFRLNEFYPNFAFDYSYPEVNDQIEAKDPGVLLDLKTPFGKADVNLYSNRPGRNTIADETHIGGWLEFYWEVPEELAQAIDGRPDAKWAETNRTILIGAEQLIYYLADGKLSSEPLHAGRFYPFPNREKVGFTMKFLYPDAAYLKSTPTSDGEELLNPVAKVEVWHKGGAGKEAFLYPGGKRGGIFQVAGTDYFLALESFKDMETKYYRSELSVLGENEEVLKSQSIVVNEPMLYGGYRFYQSDYDPDRPNYSGIGVSHEPGLYVIYFGFAVLVLGSFLMFYGKYRKQVGLG